MVYSWPGYEIEEKDTTGLRNSTLEFKTSYVGSGWRTGGPVIKFQERVGGIHETAPCQLSSALFCPFFPFFFEVFRF